jgi:2-hydroxychromene-2-carboxylate isomerase
VEGEKLKSRGTMLDDYKLSSPDLKMTITNNLGLKSNQISVQKARIADLKEELSDSGDSSHIK